MAKLLIADDHLLFRECLKSILKNETDLVIDSEAADLMQILDILSKREIDLITLDLAMPDVSGIESIRQIRRINKKVKILVVSMHPEDRIALMCIKMGAGGYITKEKSPEELIDAIRRILAGGRYLNRKIEDLLSEEEIEEDSSEQKHKALSDREYEIFIDIASGMKAAEIAEKLSLSTSTVNTHRARILDKLNMKTNVDLTYYAMKNKLID